MTNKICLCSLFFLSKWNDYKSMLAHILVFQNMGTCLYFILYRVIRHSCSPLFFFFDNVFVQYLIFGIFKYLYQWLHFQILGIFFIVLKECSVVSQTFVFLMFNPPPHIFNVNYLVNKYLDVSKSKFEREVFELINFVY